MSEKQRKDSIWDQPLLMSSHPFYSTVTQDSVRIIKYLIIQNLIYERYVLCIILYLTIVPAAINLFIIHYTISQPCTTLHTYCYTLQPSYALWYHLTIVLVANLFIIHYAITIIYHTAHLNVTLAELCIMVLLNDCSCS